MVTSMREPAAEVDTVLVFEGQGAREVPGAAPGGPRADGPVK